MKILAILVLVATIAGAGAVLYGVNTLRPQVVQTAASETRAQDAADTFAALVSQLENNTFGGKIFGGTGDLPAPVEGVRLVVSLITASAAQAEGRSTDDLLVVGEAVRDEGGRIIGVTGFGAV